MSPSGLMLRTQSQSHSTSTGLFYWEPAAPATACNVREGPTVVAPIVPLQLREHLGNVLAVEGLKHGVEVGVKDGLLRARFSPGGAASASRTCSSTSGSLKPITSTRPPPFDMSNHPLSYALLPLCSLYSALHPLPLADSLLPSIHSGRPTTRTKSRRWQTRSGCVGSTQSPRAAITRSRAPPDWRTRAWTSCILMRGTTVRCTPPRSSASHFWPHSSHHHIPWLTALIDSPSRPMFSLPADKGVLADLNAYWDTGQSCDAAASWPGADPQITHRQPYLPACGPAPTETRKRCHGLPCPARQPTRTAARAAERM